MIIEQVWNNFTFIESANGCIDGVVCIVFSTYVSFGIFKMIEFIIMICFEKISGLKLIQLFVQLFNVFRCTTMNEYSIILNLYYLTKIIFELYLFYEFLKIIYFFSALLKHSSVSIIISNRIIFFFITSQLANHRDSPLFNVTLVISVRATHIFY